MVSAIVGRTARRCERPTIKAAQLSAVCAPTWSDGDGAFAATHQPLLTFHVPRLFPRMVALSSLRAGSNTAMVSASYRRFLVMA